MATFQTPPFDPDPCPVCNSDRTHWHTQLRDIGNRIRVSVTCFDCLHTFEMRYKPDDPRFAEAQGVPPASPLSDELLEQMNLL